MTHVAYDHYIFSVFGKYIGVSGFHKKLVVVEHKDKASVWSFIPGDKNNDDAMLFYIQNDGSEKVIRPGALHDENYLVAIGEKDSKFLMRVVTDSAISDGATVSLYMGDKAVSCEEGEVRLADVPVEIRLEKVAVPGRAGVPAEPGADEEEDDISDDVVDAGNKEEGELGSFREDEQAASSGSGAMTDPMRESRQPHEAGTADALSEETACVLQDGLSVLAEEEELLKGRIRQHKDLLSRYRKQSEECARLRSLSKQLEGELGRFSSLGEDDIEVCREHTRSLLSALPNQEKAWKLFLAENELVERLKGELERGRELKDRLSMQCESAEKECADVLRQIEELDTQLKQKQRDFLDKKEEATQLREKLQAWLEEDRNVADSLGAVDLNDALEKIERHLSDCDRTLRDRIKRTAEAVPGPVSF